MEEYGNFPPIDINSFQYAKFYANKANFICWNTLGNIGGPVITLIKLKYLILHITDTLLDDRLNPIEGALHLIWHRVPFTWLANLEGAFFYPFTNFLYLLVTKAEIPKLLTTKRQWANDGFFSRGNFVRHFSMARLNSAFKMLANIAMQCNDDLFL